MDPNMKRWQQVSSKIPLGPASEKCSPQSSLDRCSSTYSTCSDYEVRDVKSNGFEDLPAFENFQRTSRKTKDILQLTRQNTLKDAEATLDDTNYSVDILDKNLDVLTDDDIFTDCEDTSSVKLDQLMISDFDKPEIEQDSTVYIQPSSLPKIRNVNPDYFYKMTASSVNSKSVVSCDDQCSNLFSTEYNSRPDRLITICEETEHTRDSNSVSHRTTIFSRNVSKECIVNFNQIQFDDKLRDHNKNIPEKALFSNSSLISKVRKTSQSKQDYLKKNINIARNNHNTTESFIQWEKFFKATEHLNSRRSKSFSDLSSKSEDYNGDIECSGKNLDFSVTMNESSINETISQKKHSRLRTKSCDSLLEEVKHLPHVFYEKFDQFLESLSKEIENIRGQKVVCTCKPKCLEKSPLEDHSHLKPPSTRPNMKICRETACTTANFASRTRNSVSLKSSMHHELFSSESDADSKTSPVQVLRSESKLSPELLRVPSPKYCANNPHCSPKTPTSPFKKRGLYPWEKEVVSPVGEYIKGKRPSPFQKSPMKRL